MAEAKLNPDLMRINHRQLEEHVSRSEIRRERREVLENILNNREDHFTKAGNRRFRLSRLLILLVLACTFSASYLIYYLSLE